MRKTVSITVDEKTYEKWLDLCFKIQEIAIKNRKTISKGRIGELVLKESLENLNIEKLKKELKID